MGETPPSVVLLFGVDQGHQETQQYGRSESNRQIRREFSLLAQVRHRCIPQVFEYIPSEGAVIMEHIHGVDLRHLLNVMKEKKERMFTETIEIGCEIADALYRYIHS